MVIYFIEVYVLIDEKYCILSLTNEHSPKVRNIRKNCT